MLLLKPSLESNSSKSTNKSEKLCSTEENINNTVNIQNISISTRALLL